MPVAEQRFVPRAGKDRKPSTLETRMSQGPLRLFLSSYAHTVISIIIEIAASVEPTPPMNPPPLMSVLASLSAPCRVIAG